MHSGVQHLSNITVILTRDRFLGKDGVRLREEILIGRPGHRRGLPVALYNRHLAVLQHKLESINKISGERYEDIKACLAKDVEMLGNAERFLRRQLEDYAIVNSRCDAAQTYFTPIFGYQHLSTYMPGTIYSTKVDNAKEIPRVIVEIKRSADDPGELALRSVHHYAQRLLELKVCMLPSDGNHTVLNI